MIVTYTFHLQFIKMTCLSKNRAVWEIFLSPPSQISASPGLSNKTNKWSDSYCWIAFISNSIHTIHCILEAHRHQVLNNSCMVNVGYTFVESNANADCKWNYCFVIWHSRKYCVTWPQVCYFWIDFLSEVRNTGRPWGNYEFVLLEKQKKITMHKAEDAFSRYFTW